MKKSVIQATPLGYASFKNFYNCLEAVNDYLISNQEGVEHERVTLMFECLTICKKNLNNLHWGREICSLCAKICANCGNPTHDIASQEHILDYAQLQHYLNVTSEHRLSGEVSLQQGWTL